jgi:O-antigen ligase
MRTTWPARSRNADDRAQFVASLSLPLILGGIVLAGSWLVPGHFPPWLSYQQEFLAAVAAILICLAAAREHRTVLWPALAIFAAALALVPWLQYGLGRIRFLSDAFVPSMYLFALALVIGASATMSAGRLGGQLREMFTASCVAAAVVCSGIALFQGLRLTPPGDWLAGMPPDGRAYANLGQPNHLASLLALGAAGVLRWYETRRIGAVVAWLALAWLAIGMGLTQSRTAWVFVLLLVTGCVALHRRAALRTRPGAALAGGLAFAALVWLVGPLLSLWLPSDDALTHAVRTEAGTRLLHWRVLGHAVLASPWFGYGWEQVAPAQFALAGQHPPTGEVLMHSHNLVLDLAIYQGIPLTAVLVLAFCAWLARTLVQCRNGETWSLIAAMLALLAHAMLEYPLHYFYFLLPFGLLVGLLPAPARAALPSAPTTHRFWLWLPLILMAGLLTWLHVEYLRTEEAVRRLRFASARIGMTLSDLRPMQVTLLDGWKAYHDATLIDRRAGMPAAELALLRDVAMRFPYAPALSRYAVALGLNEQPDEAKKVLEHFCKVTPEEIQAAMREAWSEEAAKAPALQRIEFPSCAG